MSFSAGDEIHIEKKRDSGWWVGTCRGKKGYFPHNYVEEMDVSVIEKRKDSGFGSGLHMDSFSDL